MTDRVEPPADDDDARGRGRRLAIDGLLRARFGGDAGDAGDRALAQLRGAQGGAGLASRSGSTRPRSVRVSTRRRRTRPRARTAIVVVAAAAAAVVIALVPLRAPDRAPGARVASGTLHRSDGVALAATVPDGAPVEAIGDARLVLADGSEVVLTAGTRLSSSADRDGLRIRLRTGRIAIAARPQEAGRPLRVTTADAEAAVVGTRFTVVRDDDGTRVLVDDGRVRVVRAADGARVDVPAGRVARALDAPPADPLHLLPVDAVAELPTAWATEPAAASLLAEAAARPCADGASLPGLVAQFFAGPCFAETRLTRIDRAIAFRWRSGEPADADRPVGPEARGMFSARWSGLLRAPTVGSYAFATIADDGVRVWIDGRRVIDDWRVHPATRAAGRCDLAAGPHPLVVEYCQVSDRAELTLRWTPPGGAEAIVPAAALVHAPCGADR